MLQDNKMLGQAVICCVYGCSVKAYCYPVSRVALNNSCIATKLI